MTAEAAEGARRRGRCGTGFAWFVFCESVIVLGWRDDVEGCTCKSWSPRCSANSAVVFIFCRWVPGWGVRGGVQRIGFGVAQNFDPVVIEGAVEVQAEAFGDLDGGGVGG